MKVLVISGGGAKGAFGGGIAEYVIKDCNRQYDIFIGTSVGSLMIPLLSLGEVDRLKKVFTSVTQADIFNNCPFLISKTAHEQFKTRINHFGIVRAFLKGKKTLGESENLRQLIQKNITEQDFEIMKHNKPEVIVTVSNLSCKKVEYKSLKECSYDDFCDWVWASANVLPFMSLMKKDGFEYGDGGMGNILPVYEAFNRGASEIDIILLNSETNTARKKTARNALELTVKAFDFMLSQILLDDIIIGKLEGLQRHVKLNFFQPQEQLTSNPLIFDPDQLKNWWTQGYKYARDIGPCKTVEIKEKILEEATSLTDV